MPEIRSMTPKFANTCIYGAHHWGIQEFCAHFECTEEEVEAQFHRLWKNANNFRDRWTTLVRNTERNKMRNNRRRQSKSSKRKVITRAKGVAAEGTVVIAAEGVQELAPATATLNDQEEEHPILNAAAIRARMTEIEQGFPDNKAAVEQLKQKMLDDKVALEQLKQKMLDVLAEYEELKRQLEDLKKQKDEARRIRVHVRKGGFVDVHLNGGAWDMDKVNTKARDDVPRYLLGFDFSKAGRSEMTNVCMAIARCLYAEERLALEGKTASFDFADSLTERAYEYACATRSTEEV